MFRSHTIMLCCLSIAMCHGHIIGMGNAQGITKKKKTFEWWVLSFVSQYIINVQCMVCGFDRTGCNIHA